MKDWCILIRVWPCKGNGTHVRPNRANSRALYERAAPPVSATAVIMLKWECLCLCLVLLFAKIGLYADHCCIQGCKNFG